jgi:hypothetical protein
MPKLLRLHFASIGHRDARLAPLTLDLRGASSHGTDSCLWLRNGGGKSSILNLFFSLLRPERREFLGATAEARARRLEDYVQANDLGFVISEWDLSPPGGATSLFESPPAQIWLVGQMLAWKAGQRSSDASRLRRLFFSLRGHEPARFETLPVQGLGPEPARSVEAFKEYLHGVQAEHPHLEVVTEEAVRRWSAHLERLRLDPELFQYQIKMNQREGAADELFRFRSAKDFAHFLLELALEPGIANRVADNLSELRDQLRRRPALALEQSFLETLQGRLGPLAQAVGSLRQLEGDHEAVTGEAAATSAGLEARASRRGAEAARATREGQAAEQRARELQNQQRTLLRWTEGLERHARRLELSLAEAALADRRQEEDQARGRVATGRAAVCLQQQRRCDAEVRALREALDAEEAELRPLRQKRATAGAALSTGSVPSRTPTASSSAPVAPRSRSSKSSSSNGTAPGSGCARPRCSSCARTPLPPSGGGSRASRPSRHAATPSRPRCSSGASASRHSSKRASSFRFRAPSSAPSCKAATRISSTLPRCASASRRTRA